MEKLDAKHCYAILGLESSATQAQRKEAYRNLAKQWHPDKNADNPELRAQAEEKMKRINAAYDFLKSYSIGSDNSSPQEQRSWAEKNIREAEEAEYRKQEAERQRQKTEQQEKERRRQQAEQWKRQAERQKQESEQRKQKAEQQQKEIWKQEAERRKQKVEQLAQQERDRQEYLKKLREDEDERQRIQKQQESRKNYEREQLTEARKKINSASHHFINGKCLRCGRSKASLAFYPEQPCL